MICGHHRLPMRQVQWRYHCHYEPLWHHFLSQLTLDHPAGNFPRFWT